MNRDRLIQTLLFLLPIGSILYIYRGVVFFGGIFANQDVIYNYLPYYFDLLKGNIIDFGLLGGFPVYTTMQATWFSPITHGLLSIFSPANAYIFADVFYVLLTYVFCYLFARKLKLSHEVAIISATIYFFAGQVMLWSQTPLITLYHFMLPASLYLYEVYKETTRIWLKIIFLALIGGLFGIGWISGHVQFNVYVHTFFAIYVFFDAFIWNKASKKTLANLLGVCALVFIISFMVGLPQIDAVLATQPLSLRSDGVDISQHYALGYTPYTLIQYVLPSFRIYFPPVSQSFQNYIGILPLVLLLAWYLSLRKKYPKIADKKYTFFVGVFVFCILISIYKSPLAMLIHYVPLYKSFREAVRMMFIGDFALALMVGYIIQAIITQQFSADSFKKVAVFLKRIVFYIFIPGAIIATAFKFFFLSRVETILKNHFIATQFKSSGDLPLEHYTTLLHTYLDRDVSQFTLMSVHLIGLLVVAILVYFLLKKAGHLTTKKFLCAAICILVLDFSFVYYDRFPTVPQSELAHPGETAQFILDREGNKADDYRYITVLGETALWRESVRCVFPDLNNWNLSPAEFELRREMLDPNFNLYTGLQSADGYEPFMVRHINDVIGYVGSRQSAGASVLSTISSLPTLPEKISTLLDRKNAIRSMNIKYIVSPYEIKDADLTEVHHETVGDCKSNIYIYELSNPYPRFFLTKNVTTQEKIDPIETMQTIASSTLPIVILNGATTTVVSSETPALPVEASYIGNSIKLTLPPLQSDYVMGIEVTWMPGWHARIDGKEVPLYRANHWAMALTVPKTSHEIELYYAPTSYFKLP